MDGDDQVQQVGGPTKPKLSQDEKKILKRARDRKYRKRQREEGREAMATVEAWGKGEAVAQSSRNEVTKPTDAGPVAVQGNAGEAQQARDEAANSPCIGHVAVQGAAGEAREPASYAPSTANNSAEDRGTDRRTLERNTFVSIGTVQTSPKPLAARIVPGPSISPRQRHEEAMFGVSTTDLGSGVVMTWSDCVHATRVDSSPMKAKEKGLLYGRRFGERVRDSRHGAEIRASLRESELSSGAIGYAKAESELLQFLPRTTADLAETECDAASLFYAFVLAHEDTVDLAVLLRQENGQVWSETALAESHRPEFSDESPPLTIRIRDNMISVIPSTASNTPAPSNEEIEVLSIIFNSNTGEATADRADCRLQSARTVRKVSMKAQFASYFVSAYLQVLLSDGLLCVSNYNLVVAAPRFLFSLPGTAPQLLHRDHITGISAVGKKNHATILHHPISLFLMSNLVCGAIRRFDLGAEEYDFGGFSLGVISRPSDDATIVDMYRQFHILEGDESNYRTVRKIRNKWKKTAEGRILLSRCFDYMTRQESNTMQVSVGLNEFVLCYSDVPHRGAGTEGASSAKNTINSARRESLTSSENIRHCPIYKNYVNHLLWQLRPRFHITLDAAKSKETISKEIGQFPKLEGTFMLDPFHRDYNPLPYTDDRVNPEVAESSDSESSAGSGEADPSGEA